MLVGPGIQVHRFDSAYMRPHATMYTGTTSLIQFRCALAVGEKPTGCRRRCPDSSLPILGLNVVLAITLCTADLSQRTFVPLAICATLVAFEFQ